MLNPVNYASRMRDEILRLLPTASRREKDAFAALDLNEQAWRFMNWLSRRVHSHPRQLKIAEGFYDLPAVRANQIEVESVLTKISEGRDLTPHLSEDVEQGYCLHPPGRKHGRDFDMLLNEWGIHHLHLSSHPGRRGFNRRTKDLLYVIFFPGVAFVLAVASHDAWTDRTLVELAVRSWPELRLFVSLNGVLPGRDFTEDEHKALRKAGLTTAAVINERPWISGITCGISSALVSVRTSRDSSRILRCIRQANEHPEQLERQFVEHARTNDLAWPQFPMVDVRCFNGPDRYCFGFFEEACGASLLI